VPVLLAEEVEEFLPDPGRGVDVGFGGHGGASVASRAGVGNNPATVISVVVPAYNEAAQIAEVVASIRRPAEAVAPAHEIIVVDDDSADGTGEIARDAGADVLRVGKRHIAAVRNAGARAATGDVLVFVDGDTFLNERTLAAALRALDEGAVGGGALCRFDRAPISARAAILVCAHGLRMFGLCGGCFMFTRREAFEQIGGFDEALYASEEIALARALRARGRFVVVREPIVTSGRKARRYSTARLLLAAARIGLRGPRGVRQREGLEIWYDGEREEKPGTFTDS